MNKTEGILDMFSPNIEAGYPFYYTSRPAVFSFISDKQLSLAAPFVAYVIPLPLILALSCLLKKNKLK
jgi:hypothetical protein